jgi:hypothetical protein
MLKKTINYVDFNGLERTEDFYFNLTEAEALEMNMSIHGGFAAWVRQVVDAKDQPTLVKIFKDFILKTYGEKSLDGKRFIKSEELSTAFSQTGAYVKLYMELATDAEAASAFVNGVMPSNMQKSVATTN